MRQCFLPGWIIRPGSLLTVHDHLRRHFASAVTVEEDEAEARIIPAHSADVGNVIIGVRIGVTYMERSWDGSTVVSETKTMEAVEVPSDGNMMRIRNTHRARPRKGSDAARMPSYNDQYLRGQRRGAVRDQPETGTFKLGNHEGNLSAHHRRTEEKGREAGQRNQDSRMNCK